MTSVVMIRRTINGSDNKRLVHANVIGREGDMLKVQVIGDRFRLPVGDREPIMVAAADAVEVNGSRGNVITKLRPNPYSLAARFQ